MQRRGKGASDWLRSKRQLGKKASAWRRALAMQDSAHG
jgi:hypothetical protein